MIATSAQCTARVLGIPSVLLCNTFYKMKIVLTVTTLWFLLASVCGIDFTYTMVGYVDVGGNKVHCINDCVNNLCIIDESLQEYRCTPSSTPSPVSYTFQKRTSSPLCLSRCDFIHTTYSWCYVSQSGTWDYCNGNYAGQWVRDQRFTVSQGPCMNECMRDQCDSTDCKYRCEHFWGSSDYCVPNEGYDYIQANTQGGGVCHGRCFYHDGYTYMWCYHGSKGDWDRCAPPTMPRRVTWRQRLADLTLPRVPQRVKPTLTLGNRTMSQLVSDIIYDHTLFIASFFNNNRNSLYKYAHEFSRSGDRSPVLVRAEVTRQHLREVNEQPGLLIAMGLGGPQEAFNTVMQQSVATTHFAEEKRAIQEFLTQQADKNPRVKIDAVVMNRDIAIAFLVHTKYYLNDELHQEYSDVVPNN